MYKRREPAVYIWIFPLIAGICTIIAILTPTASYSSMGVSWSWWMWDFSSMSVVGYPPVSFFLSDLDFIILSIITTIAITLCAVNLFILSNTTRKRILNTKDFALMSIISAVLSISIMIYYAFAVAFAFNDGLIVEGILFPPGFHFWFEFRPSFGIVLPFISAILSFIGVGLFRYYSNRRSGIVPPGMEPARQYIPPQLDTIKKYSPPKIDTFNEYPSVSIPKEVRNYCPECGQKILRANANFCINCGFKF